MLASIALKTFFSLAELLAQTSGWIVLGLLAAGIARAVIPSGWMRRAIGKPGLASVVKASLLGVPLPVCSCGVIPMAAELRRQGASRGASAAFAISTPQTGEESIPLTWVLLGPWFAIARPIAAVATAATVGLVTDRVTRVSDDDHLASPGPRDVSEPQSCCGSADPPKSSLPLTVLEQNADPAGTTACCASGATTQAAAVTSEQRDPLTRRAWTAVRYAFGTLLLDLAPALAVGLLLAAVASAFIPAGGLGGWTEGTITPLLLALVASLPLYVCATSATPLAAALVAGGLSPGAALVLLLAGPASNLATMAWVLRDLGKRVLAVYLGGIASLAVGFGWLVDRFGASLVRLNSDWTSAAAAHHGGPHGHDDAHHHAHHGTRDSAAATLSGTLQSFSTVEIVIAAAFTAGLIAAIAVRAARLAAKGRKPAAGACCGG
ncbi:MAG: SO_0444 family Cu/Zn efflux transporter [Planctomycetota bacterium]